MRMGYHDKSVVYLGVAVACSLLASLRGADAENDWWSNESPGLVDPLLAGNAAASDAANRRRMVLQFSDRPKLGTLRPCRREHGSVELHRRRHPSDNDWNACIRLRSSTGQHLHLSGTCPISVARKR